MIKEIGRRRVTKIWRKRRNNEKTKTKKKIQNRKKERGKDEII